MTCTTYVDDYGFRHTLHDHVGDGRVCEIANVPAPRPVQFDPVWRAGILMRRCPLCGWEAYHGDHPAAVRHVETCHPAAVNTEQGATMDKLQEEARRIAIEAAKQDPDLHDYTLPVRTLKPWAPHTWVVNAITTALAKRTPVQVGAAVTDSSTNRFASSSGLRAVITDIVNKANGRIEHRVIALETALATPRTEIEACNLRCDALASRIEQLESGRTGPKHGDTSRDLRTFLAPEVSDPTTEALRNAADLAERFKAEERAHRNTIEHKNAIDRELQAARVQRDKDTNDFVALRRLVALPQKGAPIVDAIANTIGDLQGQLEIAKKEREEAVASKVRKRERLTEATLLIDRIAKAVGRGLDASTALGSREQNTTEILKWIEATKSTIADQATQITELRGEINRREAQWNTEAERHERDHGAAAKVLESERDTIRGVWKLIGDRDGHGSPFWTDPGDHDLPSAVAHVLAHLRNKCTMTLKEHDEQAKELHAVRLKLTAVEANAKSYADTSTQLRDRMRALESARDRLQELQTTTASDNAKLRHEAESVRGDMAMIDKDRCDLRMDLDTAKATIEIQRPLCDSAVRWRQSRDPLNYATAAGKLGADAGFIEMVDAYVDACAKAEKPTLGDEDDGKGCGTEGCSDPDCPA
jgi:hypothetical protein